MSAIELTFEELVNTPPSNVMLPTKKLQSASFGFQASTSKGRGMEFDEMRAYVPGDDIRNIDWSITARTGKPQTKLYREERERSTYIITDLSEGMYFGSTGQLKARLATLLTASISWQALNNQDKVSNIVLINNEIARTEPRGRNRDVLEMLKQLREYYYQGLDNSVSNKTIGDALKLLSEIIRPGSVIYVISDFYKLSQKAVMILRYLNKSHIVYCYQVFDRMEIELTNQGMIYAENNNSIGYITSSDKQYRDDYRKIGIHRMRILSTQLKRSCQRYIRIDASKQ